MKSWRFGIMGGLVSLALSGCEDPGEIVPAAPPGAAVPRESPDTETPVAQGEMAAPVLPSGSEAMKVVEYTPALPTPKGQTKTTAHGVKYETIREGTGPELKPGQAARVQYEGKLENGKVFDTTYRNGQPRVLTIDAATLIKGWAEALPGMKVGEIRKLVVPPEQAYGAQGTAIIPPNSTLYFEVELVDIL